MMTTNEQRPRRNLIGRLTLNASRSLRRRAEQFRLSALDAGAPPIQVFIATTLGTVGVQGLSIEPGAALSVMCIGGRPRETRVSRAYHGFVAQGTGIVEKRYGAGPYRMDVSGEIDTGSSWQLGAVTAHALYRVGRLVQGIDRLDRQPSWIVWATGAARASDGVVECVEAVADKLQIVLPKLIEVARAGIRVSVVVPVANADDISQQQRADIARHNIEWCTVATVDDLERLLGADRRTRLPVPAGLAALATLTILLIAIAYMTGVPRTTSLSLNDAARPSFDCNEYSKTPRNPVSDLMCHDVTVAASDFDMSLPYNAVKGILEKNAPDERVALQDVEHKEWRAWLDHNKCNVTWETIATRYWYTTDCLKNINRARQLYYQDWLDKMRLDPSYRPKR